jgi:hypothetical protein
MFGAERYDRDLTDIFAVQDDVTRQITCRCRKSDPDVTMVQSAEDRQRKNATDRVDRPRER